MSAVLTFLVNLKNVLIVLVEVVRAAQSIWDTVYADRERAWATAA